MTDKRKYEITARLLKKIRNWFVSTEGAELQTYFGPDKSNYTGYAVIAQVAELRAWEDVSFMQDLVQDMLALPGLSDKLIFRAQFQNGVWWIELFHYLPRSFNEPTRITRHAYRLRSSNLSLAIWSMLASYYELLTVEETAMVVIERVESEMFTGAFQVTKLADEMKAKTQQRDKKQQVLNELLARKARKMTQLTQLENEIAELRRNAT